MGYDIVVGRNEADRKKYGMKGTILIAKHYVKMGEITTLSNKVYMDIAKAHVLFICGKRGGGKCLTGDSLITLSDGSKIPIRDLEKNDKDILCLNKNHKIQSSVKIDFFKRTVNKLLKIKLRTGKTIKLTPEHPLLTVDGWIKAEDLSINSRIATPRKLDFFGENVLSESKIKLLSYLIAEGHLGNNKVLFSNKDDLIVNDFKNAVSQFDSNLIVNNHGVGSFSVVLSRNLNNKILINKRDSLGKFSNGIKFQLKHSLKKWLNELNIYNTNSYTKFIPNCIFTATKSNICLFLNRLFSCDGSIYFDKNKNSWRISYASSSNRLITDVQSILLKIGIIGKIRPKKIMLNSKLFHSFELEIQSAFVRTFVHEIGFFGKKEERQLRCLIETENKKTNPNLDTIPKEVWDNYRPNNWADIGRSIGYSNPKSLRQSINYSPSRQKLLQIALHDKRYDIAALAMSDIYWDEISQVDVLEGEFEVYDISVPEHHNFIANDIIVHNSYTMGVIAEGMLDLEPEVKKNLSIIMLDTMGIYWTMKYPNHKDEELLKDWGLEGKALDVTIYTPKGYFKQYKEDGIPTDFPFAIKPRDMDVDDWLLTFDLDENNPIGILIMKTLHGLRKDKPDFSINDFIDAIRKDDESEKNHKNSLINRLKATEDWGLFDAGGTAIKDLASAGAVVVLDVSCYATMPGGWKVKSIVIGIVAKKLFIDRMVSRKFEEFRAISGAEHYFAAEKPKDKDEMPLVWLVIDEAHEFLPKEGKTSATDALVTIMREGRQPGISLILATQQPGKIHTDVMTQSDIVLSHRITAKMDVEALGLLMQSYMRKGLTEQLDQLPRVQGAAILFDDSNERMYPIRIRPRFTWHGGEAPIAIHPEKHKINL